MRNEKENLSIYNKFLARFDEVKYNKIFFGPNQDLNNLEFSYYLWEEKVKNNG